jgi:hypothetical protein
VFEKGEESVKHGCYLLLPTARGTAATKIATPARAEPAASPAAAESPAAKTSASEPTTA